MKSMVPFWTVGEVTQVTGREESSLNAVRTLFMALAGPLPDLLRLFMKQSRPSLHEKLQWQHLVVIWPNGLKAYSPASKSTWGGLFLCCALTRYFLHLLHVFICFFCRFLTKVIAVLQIATFYFITIFELSLLCFSLGLISFNKRNSRMCHCKCKMYLMCHFWCRSKTENFKHIKARGNLLARH